MTNKTLLIIGGCGGIGFSCVRDALATGLRVVVMDLEAALESREMPDEVMTIPVDLRDEVSISKAFMHFDSKYSTLDYVIVASGYTSELVNVANMDMGLFDEIYSGNLRGIVSASRESAKRVAEGGALVLISSAIGQVGVKGYLPYATAKAGVNALTRILAAELAPTVRVNAVSPGPVDTAFIRGGFGRGGAEDGDPARISIDDFKNRTPLGRIAVSDDISGPVMFLLSNQARFITGQVLHVNGGSFMRD